MYYLQVIIIPSSVFFHIVCFNLLSFVLGLDIILNALLFSKYNILVHYTFLDF